MRILTVLTYYRPYTSGLTIYAERLAEALATRGHEVSVLAMQHEPTLAREETRNNVHVIRAAPLLKLSKGMLSLNFWTELMRRCRDTDVVHLHLPQFEAGLATIIAKVSGRPVVATYHCDLLLPPGLMNRIANAAVLSSQRIAGACMNRVVGYTEDYANNSAYLRSLAHKRSIVLPPVCLPEVSQQEVSSIQERWALQPGRPRILMAARLAAEKGVEVLLDALPLIQKSHPDAQVIFAGQYRGVIGEAEYETRILPRVAPLEASGHWRWMGVLNPSEMVALYRACDLLVVPSLNATESFGLVQIEAMMNGVPVVASNLPGVRQPVQLTGGGKIAAIGDSANLAQTILDVLANLAQFQPPNDLHERFSALTCAARYEEIYSSLGTR